jgi:hypothetical protein
LPIIAFIAFYTLVPTFEAFIDEMLLSIFEYLKRLIRANQIEEEGKWHPTKTTAPGNSSAFLE